MFCIQGSPDCVGCFSNSVPFNQLPRHRREHVIVFIDALQSLAGKLALHGECHEEFLPHQAEARSLHGSLRAKKLHVHGPSLPDPPGPAAGLPQSVQRVAGLIKDDGWEIQQIQTCFY
jgi:hypothetical protein